MKAVRLIPKDPPAAYWAARRRYIGGSDIARLVAGDLWSVWGSKTGAAPTPDTEAMAWGRRLEAFVAQEWAARHPEYRVRQVHALLGHPHIPWMAASVDRMVYGPADGPYVLEIKTTGQVWDTVPDPYIAQCLWYCAVTDAPRALLAVLVRGQRLEEYVVERQPDLETALFNLGAAFWVRLQANDPPPLDASAAARAWLLTLYPRAATTQYIDLPVEARADLATFQAAQETIRHAAVVRDRAAAHLKAAIGEAAGAVADDLRLTWVRRTTRRLDQARLRADHPDLAASYTTETTEDGGLRLSPRKGGSS